MEKFDLIIIGGGMVGATLACALGNTPLSIAVVEPAAPEPHWDPAEYDIRVSAITRATQRVFERVGAWEGMVARRVCPYRRMEVWDGDGPGAIRFDCTELGEPDLGHIIENRVILAALLEQMARYDNIQYLCPAVASTLRADEGGVELTLADGSRLAAALLVGADGSASWVREQAGITTSGWPYHQTAVVCTVRTALHHNHVAYQRFLPNGPLAFLPLPEGLSSIVWSTTPEQAEGLLALPEDEFLAALYRAFGDPLGAMESVGPRGGFPLRLQHADDYVRPGIALIGNAAHTIHPLAGQGLNIGVLDATALAEVVLTARRERRGLGSLRVLRRYERWRKGDNVATMLAMDGFKRLFGNTLPPVRWMRALGLNLADRSGPAKRLMVRRAMGLSGDLPPLARSGRG